MEEAIASLIWATPRLLCDVSEFKQISEELAAKYGKEFSLACRSNQMSNVSQKVMHKLSVLAPPRSLVERYMVEIARTYNVPFVADASIVYQDEIMRAENLLIDFNADPTTNSQHIGIGRNMAIMSTHSPQVSNAGPIGFLFITVRQYACVSNSS